MIAFSAVPGLVPFQISTKYVQLFRILTNIGQNGKIYGGAEAARFSKHSSKSTHWGCGGKAPARVSNTVRSSLVRLG